MFVAGEGYKNTIFFIYLGLSVVTFVSND